MVVLASAAAVRYQARSDAAAYGRLVAAHLARVVSADHPYEPDPAWWVRMAVADARRAWRAALKV